MQPVNPPSALSLPCCHRWPCSSCAAMVTIDKVCSSPGNHFPHVYSCCLRTRVISALSQGFQPQREPIPPSPHLIPLSLPLSRSSVFTSNPPVSVRVPVARLWRLPSCVSLCHTLAAPAVSLPLLFSAFHHHHPSFSRSVLFSLLTVLPPILPVSLASLFSAPLLVSGKSLLKTNFCLPLTQSKGLRVAGSRLFLRPGKWQLLVSFLLSSCFVFPLRSPSSTIQGIWCMHGKMCVRLMLCI